MKIKQPQKNTAKGFSLVETIIYIFLVSILTVAVVNSLIFVSKSFNDIRATKTLSMSAISILNRLSYEIRQTDRVDDANSIFNQNCTNAVPCLTLVSTSSTVIFSVIDNPTGNNSLSVSVNGESSIPLNQPEVKISSLVFNKIVTDNSQGVSVKMNLTFNDGGIQESENFETVIMLRAPSNN